MPLERRNPLPPGVYHIDVMGKNLPAFIAWRSSHKDAVKVRKTQEDESSKIAWILFEVTRGVDWDSKAFGFPNVAERGLSTDRVPSFEPTKDVLDQLADALPKPADLRWLVWGGGAIIAFMLYREFTKE